MAHGIGFLAVVGLKLLSKESLPEIRGEGPGEVEP